MFISGRVYRVKWKRRNEDTYIELVVIVKKKKNYNFLRNFIAFYSYLYFYAFIL